MHASIFLFYILSFVVLCHAIGNDSDLKLCIACEEGTCNLSTDYKPIDHAKIASVALSGEVTYKGKANKIEARYVKGGPQILLKNKEQVDGVVNVVLKKPKEKYNYTLLYQVPAHKKCIIKGYPEAYKVESINTYVKK
jgi:hypothetical protein